MPRQAVIHVLDDSPDQTVLRVATSADIDAARDADPHTGRFIGADGQTLLLDADMNDSTGAYIF